MFDPLRHIFDQDAEGRKCCERKKYYEAYHELTLFLDLNQKVLKFLVFLSNSSLCPLVFVLEPLLMYFFFCSIVQLV